MARNSLVRAVDAAYRLMESTSDMNPDNVTLVHAQSNPGDVFVINFYGNDTRNEPGQWTAILDDDEIEELLEDT